MISWERVNELRDEVGQEDFLEVVEIFLEEVDEVVARLRSAPDPATYENDLHFLNGSAMNLGFAALSEICQLGERISAQDNATSVDVSAVLLVYEKSKIQFNGGVQPDALVA